MNRVTVLIIVLLFTGCWVHRDFKSYRSTESEQTDRSEYHIEFEITKDFKHRTLPFVFVEKSGKKDIWLVAASFRTSQKEIHVISMDVMVSNMNGEVLFEKKARKVELVDFEDYRAKTFDLGSIDKEIASNVQDTLIAVYEVTLQENSFQQTIIDTSYLVFHQMKKSGSFF